MSSQLNSLDAAVSMILPLLKSKGMREQIAKKLNDAIDIPMVNEKTEGKIIKKLIKVMIKTLEEMIEEDDEE